MRLTLFLVLLSLPAAAAVNPVEAWAAAACPDAKPANRYSRMQCLYVTAWAHPEQGPEKLEDLLEALRSAATSWAQRMCELRGAFSELDPASNQVRKRGPKMIEELFTCQASAYSQVGHFAQSLRRADGKALAENLAVLDSQVRPGSELTPRQVAVARVLASRVAPGQEPDAQRYSRERWDWTVNELAHVRRLPGRIAALRCRLHRQRDVMLPPRCEERVRRALEAELLPLTQALTKAASTLPTGELDAAEKALRSQELAWEQEQAKAPLDRTFEGSPDESQLPRFQDGMTRPEKVSAELPPSVSKRPGAFIIKCNLLTSGEVTFCRYIRHPPNVEEAIQEAVRAWRYTPAREKDQPIAVDYTFSMKLRP